MKTCETCKKEKTENEFCKETRRKDGLCKQCKECLSQRKQKYREENPDHVKKVALKSYYKNHDKTKEKKKEWIKNKRSNADFIVVEREYRKKLYHQNATEIREQQNKLKKDPAKKKKMADYMRRYRKEKYGMQTNAHKILEYALKIGHLIRPSKCEVCMKECKPDGHHEDYSKPLEVKWVCHVCHHHIHGKLLDVQP